MKKQFTKVTTLAFALFSIGAVAQDRVLPCATDEAMEQVFTQNPQARKNFEAAQARLSQQAQENAALKPSAFEYTVPVVFHVLYDCSSSQVTDAVILQALQEVNNNFSRNNSDTAQVVQPFRSSYIDSEIKFILAKKDPQGNCITGIVRHYDEKTKWSQGTANQGSVVGNAYWSYTWDPTRYLNIYLVSEIVPSGTVTGGGVIVGYTYRPGTWVTGNPHDAIVYDMDFLSGNSGGVSRARSLTHEIGHWLNLPHTFGSTNNPGLFCGDDGIADTPITRGEFGGCASSFSNSCAQTNPAMTGLNNVQNIMNYSDCPRNFTTGQTTAMRNALASAVSGRSNLYTPGNILFTDVDGTGNCAPIAEFLPTNCSYTVCEGGSLSVRDLSSNGTVTSLSWSADNGATFASPGASVTSVTFPNMGIVNVSLTASNSQGSDVKTRTFYVMDRSVGFGVNSMESFENQGLPQGWVLDNVQNDVVTWQQNTDAAYDQLHSYRIEGASNAPGNSDILQTPVMDLQNNPNHIFEFAYAYRQQSSSQNDILRVEGSRDCGGTWSTIYSMNASLMASGSGGVGTEYFIPSHEQWKVYTLSSHPQWQNFRTSSNVMIRFNFIEGSNGYGNNIYLDAIGLYGTTGVNELTRRISFNLYPNPSNGETNVSFNLHQSATVKVSVVDLMGREVLPAVENRYNEGEHTISVNKDQSLAKGVYFVNLTHNGAKMSAKLVID
jgi:hypothetical protein